MLDGGEVVLLEREVQRAPPAIIPLERRRLPFIPFQLLKIPQCFLKNRNNMFLKMSENKNWYPAIDSVVNEKLTGTHHDMF